jgi:S-adenosylmethionine decarboxylase
LDLHGCDKTKLADKDFIFGLIDELPGLIGMKKFSQPQLSVVPSRENSFDRGGLSCFVLLVESHATIHTFPHDGFASVDIFSCKEFDLDFAKRFFVERLGAKEWEENFLERGKKFVKHYPHDVGAAKKVVSGEREKAAG